MNYIHSEKLVYWGLPRTGSRYLFSCLKSAYSLEGNLSHDTKLESEYADYEILCSVRNPYWRALSTWMWMTTLRPLYYCPDSFAEFTRRVAPGFAFPITIEIGPVIEKVNYFIRIEYYEEDLKKISSFPEDFEFPKNTFQSSYHLSPKEYYADHRVADRIWDIYREDFETFGYARDSYMEESGD